MAEFDALTYLNGFAAGRVDRAQGDHPDIGEVAEQLARWSLVQATTLGAIETRRLSEQVARVATVLELKNTGGA